MHWAASLIALAVLLLPSAPHQIARPIAAIAANRSFNWAGYTQGSIEKETTFHSIAGEWIVPKAEQRNAGEAEYSSSWIGIGGGCLDTACTLFDATLIQAGRQFAYDVARRMAKGEGALQASMVKAYVCRAAEWVTREAMQLHGGMGYAEEFPVSRYFVDARVLSIFEGADETLCLRVIARRLAEQALERVGV